MFAVTVFFLASAEAKEYPVEEGVDGALPELDCVMEPSEIVDVGSAVPGVVEQIYARRSDLVKKGAVIFELESSVEQASLELAKIRAGLDTSIELRQESARFGSLTQKRNQQLLRKSAISLHDVDKSKTETRIAKLQVRQEQDNKTIAELEYHRAQMILQKRSIRSPVEGVIMERFKSVGEFVEDEPLVRVAQLNPLHVEVIVSVDYLGLIVPGMQADVTPSLTVNEKYLATVERVDRVADAASGTYGVRLSLPNPDYKIPAGLRCQLSFLPQPLDESEQVADDTGIAPAVEHANEVPILEDEEPVVPPGLTISDVISAIPLEESVEPLELCYSVGPVEDESTAQLLVEKIEQRTEKLMLRTVSSSVNNGYLVLAAEQPNPQGTHQLLARLDKDGITDRFVFAEGENKGRLSLGFYRALPSANRRKEILTLKGFETEIVPRRIAAKHYWLDVSLTAKSDISDQLQNIAASLTPAVTFKPMACYPDLVRR